MVSGATYGSLRYRGWWFRTSPGCRFPCVPGVAEGSVPTELRPSSPCKPTPFGVASEVMPTPSADKPLRKGVSLEPLKSADVCGLDIARSEPVLVVAPGPYVIPTTCSAGADRARKIGEPPISGGICSG